MKTKLKLMIATMVAVMFCIANGDAQTFHWGKYWNSSGSQWDRGWAVTTDGVDGNVYVAGEGNYLGTADVYIKVLKYNSAGTLLWESNTAAGNGGNQGSEDSDIEGGFAIALDASNNVYVAACYYNGSNKADLALFKYNGSTGAVIAGYPKLENDASGPNVSPRGTCLLVNSTGVYIGGSSYISSTNTWKFIVHKDDPGGTWAWTYTYTGSTPGNKHQVTDLKMNVGNTMLYATGFVSNTGQGTSDVFTVKLAQGTGFVQTGWPQTYNNITDNLADYANAMALTSGEDVYLCGYTKTTAQDTNCLLIKYAPAGGVPVWVRQLNGVNNYADAWTDIVLNEGVAATVLLSGYTQIGLIPGGNFNSDWALAAYTTGGLLTGTGWTTNPVTYDGGGAIPEPLYSERANAIEYSGPIGGTGRVYISGTSYEALPTRNNITTRSYNANTGAFIWTASYDLASEPGPNAEDMYNKYALRVVPGCTNRDYIYLTGRGVCCSQGWNILTLKYKLTPACGDGPEGRMMNVEEAQSGLYPNPFSSDAVLRLSEDMEITNGLLSVYDVTGRLVSTLNNITSTTIIINRGDMPSGIYFYKLTDGEKPITSGKFIIAD